MRHQGWLLTRIDYRVIPIILLLMFISITIISASTVPSSIDLGKEPILTDPAKAQLRWFGLGMLVYILFAWIDYNKLREWTWLLYLGILVALIGVFFMTATKQVNRWYNIPVIGMAFQPSESAKLIVVLMLSWFLERKKAVAGHWLTTLQAGLIVGIPFLLILKQPDLGTSLVLYPITLVIFYFGGIHRWVVRLMLIGGALATILVFGIFSGVIQYESLRPVATLVLKDYQYERLNPETFHQKAAANAIAIGGVSGTGWRKGEFSGGGWLPYPYTDSVFPAFGEMYGVIGLLILMALYYALIYFSFQVTVVAKDDFGRLLSAGIVVYLAMHVLVNMGMMLGFLPITGVPLLLVTYGGSSILSIMMALGILQSIYSRRFMF